MLKRMILYFLCLLTAVSACMAEELPSRARYCKIHMYPEIPDKTMEKMFSEYMVPGCEVYYSEGVACCDSLLNSGYGWYLNPEAVIEDSERIRNCREITEKLLHDAYPDDELELITAMSYREYEKQWMNQSDCFELKNGQWYYMDRLLTHELEGALTAAQLNRAAERERIEKIDPDWTILLYHPGPVCGLPVGVYLDNGKEYMEFCVSVFIFDAENHIVSVHLAGSFTDEPAEEIAVRVTKEEALRLAAGQVDENEAFDWRIRGWNGNAYDVLLKELGCTSIRSRMAPVASARLVMAVNKKGRLQPAWECCKSYELIIDDEVVRKQSQGMYYFYLSAEDGSPLNP